MIITTPWPCPPKQKQAKTMTITTNLKAHISKQANTSKKHKLNKNKKKRKKKQTSKQTNKQTIITSIIIN